MERDGNTVPIRGGIRHGSSKVSCAETEILGCGNQML